MTVFLNLVVMSDKMSYVDVIKYIFKRLTIMLFRYFLVLRMLVFSNSLYYSIVLLFIVVYLLFFLVVNSLISTLTMIIFTIVYIGAMMILIGYVCAISPNILTSPSYRYLYFVLLPPIFLMSPHFTSYGFFSRNNFLVYFFYSSYGAILFFLIVFMLFLILLLVTSQYMAPSSGPFRSSKFS